MDMSNSSLMSIVAPLLISWLGIIVTPLIKSAGNYMAAKAANKSELGKSLVESGFFEKLTSVSTDAVHFAEQLALAEFKKTNKPLPGADRKDLACSYARKVMGSTPVPATVDGTIDELISNSIEAALHKVTTKGD